jgi:glycosyltransferase involved in cell wall biosynthesis
MSFVSEDCQAPRVTIVVPAYNAAANIGEALASIFAQTYRDFEVIVVDDGSTDGTRDALEPWRTAITYVRQPNRGPASARNAGIQRARGGLIAFLDADDVWLPDKLDRQVEYFDVFPETGLLHTAAFLGEPRDAPRQSRRHGPLSPPRQLFCEIFETEIEIHTLTVMVRRSALDEVGLFDERREIHVEDWDLWLRIAAKYPVGHLREALAIHRRGGLMSSAPDKTFRGQMLVIAKALPTYRALCAARGRDPERHLRRPLYRMAWELGHRRLEGNEPRPARRAFREALRHEPANVKTHLYHLGAHLPAPVIDALRTLKQHVRPPRNRGRIVPAAVRRHQTEADRACLAQDTLYRRTRGRLAQRLHDIDTLVDHFRDRPRRILFEASSPLSFIVFQPMYRRLRADPRIEFYFTSATSSWPARAIFSSVGVFDHIVSPSQAAWMRLDACINTDFYDTTWLHRCASRLHIFHGVAGKYDIDAPVHLAPDIAAFDALLFPNRDRLDRYTAAGLVSGAAALLVGFPKIDCLVDGSLDAGAIKAALGFRHDWPTVLYAPTWSPESSLHVMGEAVIRTLVDARFNVLVKLHDRSYDLTRRASAGIDWMARLSVLANDERVRIVRDPYASRYLVAADALVTDHSSIGFEYALLDRPIVVIDTPTLLERARINPDKVRMLRSAAEVITSPADLEQAIVSQLADRRAHAAERAHMADTMFYRPGTATDRAISVIYDAIGLDPMDAVAEPRRLDRATAAALREAS